MKLYLDTEFNGFGGDLISLALVPSNDDKPFYEIWDIPEKPHPWVKENVLPVLSPLLEPKADKSDFMYKFSKYVYAYRDAEIYADWPADIEHFCHLLTWHGSENGFRIPANFTMKIINRVKDYRSEIPHNALHDAIALREYCKDWLGH